MHCACMQCIMCRMINGIMPDLEFGALAADLVDSLKSLRQLRSVRLLQRNALLQCSCLSLLSCVLLRLHLCRRACRFFQLPL